MRDTPTKPTYRGTLLPSQPSAVDVRSVLPEYEAMLLSVLTVMVDRFERPGNGAFIDMKIDLTTGRDFDSADPIRGPNAVYGYIQGRGLEALAEHCSWLKAVDPTDQFGALRRRLEAMMWQVLQAVRAVRERNAGHLFFFFTPDGEPFELNPDGVNSAVTLTAASPFNKSDLFGSKGMYAAARYFGNEALAVEAREYCDAVNEAIWQGTFRSDQQPLGSKAEPQEVAGRVSQSPFMLDLDAAYVLLKHERNSRYLDFGLRLIDRVVREYINAHGHHPEAERHDYWEYVSPEGEPYKVGGALISDPGHALEFVGLAMRFLDLADELGLNASETETAKRFRLLLPKVLVRNFTNGFNAQHGGIFTTIDLVTRQPVNANMPWWSLPETMRAAAYCWKLSADENLKAKSLEILGACHNAFFGSYVRRSLKLMAVQMRSRDGLDAAVIPATADADPAYHTGLSMLDVLRVFSGVNHSWQPA